MSRTQPRPPGRKGGPPRKADPLKLVEPVAASPRSIGWRRWSSSNLPGGQKLVLPG